MQNLEILEILGIYIGYIECYKATQISGVSCHIEFFGNSIFHSMIYLIIVILYFKLRIS